MKPLTLRSVPRKNMRAHPGRTVILMLLVMAQAICLMAGAMLVYGSREEMESARARLGADILVYPIAAMSKINSRTLIMQGTPVEVWKGRSMLDRMSECEGIGAVSWQLYIQDSTAEASPIWIVGFEPETDFVISPWLAGGSDITALQDGEVIAGCDACPGDARSITLFGKEWPVAMRLNETGSDMDSRVYVSLDTLKELIRAAQEEGITKYDSIEPEEDFSVALIRVEDRSRVEDVANWLNIYVRKIKAVRSEAALTDTALSISRQMRLIIAVTAVTWLALLLAMAMVQSVMMKDRRRELVVWKSIGASRRLVTRLMREEALIIHLEGSAAGVILAMLTSPVFFRTLQGVRFPASYLAVSALAVIALTLLIGSVSAGASVRREYRSREVYREAK